MTARTLVQLLALTASLGIAAESLPADDAPTSTPATNSATAPAKQPTLAPAERISSPQVVTLSSDERQVLATVQDETDWVAENAFFLLMNKVARLDKQAWPSNLDSPAPANLIDRPDRYRYEPIAMTVRIWRILQLSTANRRLKPNYYWPEGKALYEIQATRALPPGPDGTPVGKPIVIFSDHMPERLPKPTSAEKGRFQYASGPEYRIEGIFYKTIRRQGEKDELIHSLPVILAFRAEPTYRTFGHEKSGMLKAAMTVLLAFVLVAGYFFVKRHLLGKRKPTDRPRFGEYAPLRDSDEADEPIDPGLAAAAEEYRRHRADKQEDRP